MPCSVCGDPNSEVVCDHCYGMEVANEHLGSNPEVGERAYLSVVENQEEKERD